MDIGVSVSCTLRCTRFIKSQSAMEYLMTYGWSILIVAVVLGALAYLGVFNPLYFAPKANPGSCQVFRPNGAGTSYDINLLGVCNNEIPQYVASYGGSGSLEGARIINPGLNYTVSLWFNIGAPSGTDCCTDPLFDVYNAIVNNGVGANQNFDYSAIFATGQGLSFAEYWPINWQFLNTGPLSLSEWHNAIISVENYNSVTIYVDGSVGGSCIPPGCSISYNKAVLDEYFTSPAVSVGSNPPGGDEIASIGTKIANVQIYNESFDSNTADALYQEGIGGVPIDPHNLVGWWQLNGNLNDSSGNGAGLKVYEQGATFIGSWTNGYT